jgi:hypothetical protein
VRAWKEADLAGDRPDLVESPSIEPLAFVQDGLAGEDLDEVVGRLCRLLAPLGVFLRHDRDRGLLDGLDLAVRVDLVRKGHGRPHRSLPLAADLGENLRGVGRRRLPGRLLIAGALLEILLARDNPADRLVAEQDRVEHLLLGHLPSARLDHYDRVRGSRDHQVDLGLLPVGVRGVQDELAVQEADAHRADR